MSNPVIRRKASIFQWFLHVGLAVSIFAFSGFAAEQPLRIQNKIQIECIARKASTQKRVSLFQLRAKAGKESNDLSSHPVFLAQLIHFQNRIDLQLETRKHLSTNLLKFLQILKVRYAPRSADDLQMRPQV